MAIMTSSTGQVYNYPGVYANPVDQQARFSGSFVSSSFLGNSYTVLLGPLDVSKWSNLVLTVVNNHATNKLESGSVEFSADGTNWETDWNVSTFAGLNVGAVRSIQITGNSRKYFRFRGITSGSAGDFTGSIAAYLNVNGNL